MPAVHLKGGNCKKCAIIAAKKKNTLTTEEFVKKVKEKHGDKYDYSNVIYTGSVNKITIKCKVPEHNTFEQKAMSHLRGKGCPKCWLIKLTQKMSTDEFIERAIKKHGNKYDYTRSEYTGWNDKILINCKDHGDFYQKPSLHLSDLRAGTGCNECVKEKSMLSKEEFIEKANEKHGNKYDYTKSEYIGVKEKILITCKEHGDFYQIAGGHLCGNGCNECNKTRAREKFLLPKEEFIRRAQLVHGDKYDYSESIYNGFIKNISVKCLKHGIFTVGAQNHVNKKVGCKKCNLCPSCQLWRTMEKLCEYCKPPQNGNKYYTKTKEYEVVNFLKENLPNNELIHNKSVGSECTGGHLFPDIRFDCDCYQLIVEIDEFQHRGADYSCDKKRMYDIVAKMGMPCMFIRYNPDNKISDKNVLLQKIQQYLDINSNELNDKVDKYGFKVDYLFYNSMLS